MIRVSGIVFSCRQILVSCLGLLLLTTLATATETKPFYVSTHLQTGLHTQAAMDSPVIKLVSGGEAISMLKAGKKFSQVQLKDGTKGWLYSQFIVQEQPAEARVEELEKQLQDLQQQLHSAQQKKADIVVAPANSSNNAELQKQLEEYQATISQLKEELKAWEQLDFQDRQAQKEHDREINYQLKQRLTQIAVLATGQKASTVHIKVDDKKLEDGSSRLSKTLFKKEYLLIIVIGGVGFLLGILLMDMINRRRHGGYRI